MRLHQITFRCSFVSIFSTALLLALAHHANAATILFTDQAVFLANPHVSFSASFEGFESHVTGDTSNPTSSATGFTVNASTSLEIKNTPSLGSFATEGVKYLRKVGTVLFVFDNPINVFGVTLTDAADNPATTLSVSTSAGDSFPSFLANEPNGVARFFGVINEDQAFNAVTFTSSTLDGMGFDEVYFDIIPEPTTAMLLGLGLLGVAARRRVT